MTCFTVKHSLFQWSGTEPTFSLEYAYNRFMVKHWMFSAPQHEERMSTLKTPIRHHSGGPSQFNKARNKKHTNWKGRNQTTYICWWRYYLCRRSQRVYKKASRTKTEPSKVIRYKAGIWNSTPFLYTSNEQLEIEIVEASFTTAPEDIYIYESYKTYARPNYWKTQMKISRNSPRIYHIHGSIHQFSRFTDSMQCQSKIPARSQRSTSSF